MRRTKNSRRPVYNAYSLGLNTIPSGKPKFRPNLQQSKNKLKFQSTSQSSENRKCITSASINQPKSNSYSKQIAKKQTPTTATRSHIPPHLKYSNNPNKKNNSNSSSTPLFIFISNVQNETINVEIVFRTKNFKAQLIKRPIKEKGNIRIPLNTTNVGWLKINAYTTTSSLIFSKEYKQVDTSINLTLNKNI